MAALCSVCLNIHTIPLLIFLSIVFQIPPIITSSHKFTETRPPAPIQGKEPQSRESSKQKYITGLVDQAVKSLCEIWHPQDIPSVFLTSSRATVPTLPTPTPSITKLTRDTYRRNVQLPSPISPSTLESPSPISTPSPVPRKSVQPRMNDSNCSSAALVPIKGFVHEVLRRSRTSACVLQTALCYLEAIRSKVPDLVLQEKSGQAVHCEPEDRGRIMRDADSAQDAMTSDPEPDLVPTVRVNDCGSFDSSMPDIQGLGKKLTPSPSLPPLPPLPSPLLCPRRAFLASLILASKFTQDKCYSNRAWAKLSGLPPREIGRCERALGDALDWRLWVGKAPQPAPASSTRPVVRSHSDGALLSTHIKSDLTPMDAPSVKSISSVSATIPPLGRGLRRCATLPNVGALDGVSNWISRSLHSVPPSLPEPSVCGISPCDADATWYHNSQMSLEPTPRAEDNDVTFTQSPIPATPPLTLSPCSTESSSGGDRTVQMTFLDESGAAYDSGIALGPTPCPSETPSIWIRSEPLVPPALKQACISLGIDNGHIDRDIIRALRIRNLLPGGDLHATKIPDLESSIMDVSNEFESFLTQRMAPTV
ncbi:hypothetical protein ONZ45_g8720 [Pleurotus djamor]|nr:hypothetical protein ONZ45_g8720 [Pleurotus djamor]